jgi:hypothetical protein
VLERLSVSSWLASILASGEVVLQAMALRLASELMDKLPDIFSVYFVREGVIYEMQQLALLEPETPTKKEKKPEKKEGDGDAQPTSGLFGMPSSHEANDEAVRVQRMAIQAWLSREAAAFVAAKADAAESSAGVVSAAARALKDAATLLLQPNSASGDDATTKATVPPMDDDGQNGKSEPNTSMEVDGDDGHAAVPAELEGISVSEWAALCKASAALVADDGVSTFEYLSTGWSDALLTWLSPSSPALQRYRTRALRLALSTSGGGGGGGDLLDMSVNAVSPWTTLVRHIRAALNKQQSAFPVLLCSPPGRQSGLRALTRAMKLMLKPKANDTATSKLVDMGGSALLIEPLATVASVEEFLLGRSDHDYVQSLRSSIKKALATSENAASASAPASSSAAAAASAVSASDSVAVVSPESGANASAASGAASSASGNGTLSADAQPLLSFRVVSPDGSERGSVLSSSTNLFQAAFGASMDALARELVGTPREGAVAAVMARRLRESNGGRGLWTSGVVLEYAVRPVAEIVDSVLSQQQPVNSTDEAASASTSAASTLASGSVSASEMQMAPTLLGGAHPVMATQLRLLRRLHDAVEEESRGAPTDSTDDSADWMSRTLTAKVLRQLQDPLTLCAEALPAWCGELAAYAPFLLPFDVRKQYLVGTAFGLARALMSLQGEMEGLRVGRIRRQKVRIKRTRMFDSAVRVMEVCARQRSVLEVEYDGEEGTGLGPTLEFFTATSQEVLRRRRHMWHESGSGDEDAYIVAPDGCFPLPLAFDPAHPNFDAAARGDAEKRFLFLGRFVGKALADSRLIAIPFARAFLDFVRGVPLRLDHIATFKPAIGRLLSVLGRVAEKKAALLARMGCTSGVYEEDSDEWRAVDALRLPDGDRVAAWELDWTVPSLPDVPLQTSVPADTGVTVHNVEAYLALVEDWLLHRGVAVQLQAFLRGLAEMAPPHALHAFSASELELLLRGEDEPWTLEGLLAHTKCDHGYDENSQVVRDFFSVLIEFTAAEREQFLRFVTGSARLPYGGWASLSPPLTIVRKSFPEGDSPDNHLPSVMTCVSFVKLPQYSSKEKLREKLLKALEIGQGSFSLS